VNRFVGRLDRRRSHEKSSIIVPILILTYTCYASDTLPYRLSGTAISEETQDKMANAIVAFHRYIITFTDANEFPSEKVDLTFNFDESMDVYHVSMRGGWRDSGKSFKGVVSLADPHKYDGKRMSTWRVPFDEAYFLRILLHEIAPIYLERYALANGTRFYSKPNWIVQGSEEYFSHHHGRPVKPDPVLKIFDTSSLRSLRYGIVIYNPYLDGYILFRFVPEVYGKKAALRLLSSNARTTPEILRDAINANPKTLIARLQKFISELQEAAGSQQGNAPLDKSTK